MTKWLHWSFIAMIGFGAMSCASHTASTTGASIGGADLVVEKVVVERDIKISNGVATESKLVEGGSRSVSITIKNIGDHELVVKNSSKFMIPRVVIFEGEERLAMSQPIPALQAKESVTLKLETLKDNLDAATGKLTIAKAGEHTLNAVIDPAGYVEEISKDNNSKEFTITAEKKPEKK